MSALNGVEGWGESSGQSRMALDSKAEATLALNRFGLGPRTGSITAIASDPRGALIAELDRQSAGRIQNPELMSSGVATRAAFAFQQAQRELRRNAKSAPKESQESKDAAKDVAKDAAAPAGPSPGAAKAPEPKLDPKSNAGIAPQQIYLDEAKARLTTALDAEIGFVERLAWFWSNHFCVSADKFGVRPIAGAFEREAIRTNVLGRFVDMLRAVETHPAMLLYLDNARSIGPTSQAGKNRGRGLNENLAREILELHTLGVRTVYTQDDVTAFAKVITGWSIVPLAQDPERGGEFIFNPRMHEPPRARRSGSPSRHRPARGAQARKAFRRRRSCACPGRAAGQALPRHRRRSQGSRQGPRRLTRSLGDAAWQAAPADRMDRGFAARHGRERDGRSSGHAGAEPFGRATVAAAGAQWLCGR
jgi:uncharacterized protein (DUF1800 family)